MLEKYHKLQPKPRTTDELKVALQTIWEELLQEHIIKHWTACVAAISGICSNSVRLQRCIPISSPTNRLFSEPPAGCRGRQLLEVGLQTKFRWDILIHGWHITTSGFGKWTSAILKFHFHFRFDLSIVIGKSFCIGVQNVIQIGQTTAEQWCNIDFSRYRLWRRKSTSGSWFTDGTCWEGENLSTYQISMSYLKLPSVTAELPSVTTTYGFGKRTPAIFKFYIRFRFSPSHRHRHGKLHPCTAFRPNQWKHDDGMTSYIDFPRM